MFKSRLHIINILYRINIYQWQPYQRRNISVGSSFPSYETHNTREMDVTLVYVGKTKGQSCTEASDSVLLTNDSILLKEYCLLGVQKVES